MRAVFLSVLLLTSPATAQETLTPQEVEALRARVKEQRSEAEDFAAMIRRRADAQRHAAEDLAQGARANRAQTASPAGARGEGVDLDWMVAQSPHLQSGLDEMAPRLFAFVSFSMPDSALRQIIRDVAAAGGMVVFRGMPENSVQAFRARLLNVLGTSETPAGIGIDPRLFRAFQVTHAPTFVVPATGFELCDGFDCQDTPPPHDRMSGNVSVSYVLETMASGIGAGARIARVLKQRLETGQTAHEGQP